MTTGKRNRGQTRSGIDNIAADKHLEKPHGKESHQQRSTREVPFVPVMASISSEISLSTALTSMELVQSIHVEYSRTWHELAQAHGVGTSNKDSPMNPFRRELKSLNLHVARPRDIASRLSEVIALAAKAFFLDERTFTQTQLFESIRPDGAGGTIDQAYYTLVSSGRIRTCVTGRAGKGESPSAFDLYSDRPFYCSSTLRTMLEGFEQSSPSPRVLAVTYQAVRTLVGVPNHTPRGKLLTEASTIGERHFFSMLAALRFRCEAAGLSKKTRQNLLSALRKLLVWGLRSNRFALWFPEYRPADAWSSLMDTCFPTAVRGATCAELLKTRSALYTIIRVCRDELGVSSPSDLTAGDIERCLQTVAVPHRDLEAVRIRRFGLEDRRGPGDWENPVVRLIIDTIRSKRRVTCLPYLESVVPSLDSALTLEGFAAVLRSHRLPSEWEEFFAWYHNYSSLPHLALRGRRDEFPARGAKRKLVPRTFETRLMAARAFLGLARELYPDRFGSLTPTIVYGELFEDLSLAMQNRWADGASGGRGPSHSGSAGIVHHLLSAGLTAKALFDRAVHLRSRTERDVTSSSRRSDKGTRAEGGRSDDWNVEGLTGDERDLLRAYQSSMDDASELQRSASTSPRGTGLNTVKDLNELIRDTPFLHFQRVQLWIISHLEQLAKLDRKLTPEYTMWMIIALIHGLLISGGCRRGELCHLRSGVQTNLLSGNRDIKLRPVDRKNRRELSFILRDRWFPDALLASYVNDVRPRLLAEAGLLEDPHQFLILNPFSGMPYGCPEENLEDGSGRDDRPFQSRKVQLARIWKIHAAKAFVACDFSIPVGPHRFGMHVVRNVGGHAVYMKHDLDTAAAWLGDTVASVEGTYASLNGALVDTSLVD